MKKQTGYVLLSITVLLLVLAALAFLLTRQGGMGVSLTASAGETEQTMQIAMAGLEHTQWYVNNSACAGDTSGTVPFGVHNYATTVTGTGTTTAYTLNVDQDAWIRSDNTTSNNGTNIDQHIKFEGGNIEHTMYRFDLSSLPSAAQVNSAVMWLYIESTRGHPEGALTTHRVNSDWTETGATWDNMNGNFDAQVLATIPAQDQAGAAWVSINITAQVQAWVNGDPNYGILLQSTAEGVHAEHVSKEGAAAQRPRLEVIVGTAPASPATLASTGTHKNGITRVLTRTAVPAYQPTSVFFIQPDAASGKVAMPDDFYTDRNYGGANYLQINEETDWRQRPLIEFDLGRMPNGARVVSAQLELHQISVNTAGSATVHRVLRDWVEGTKSGTGQADGSTWLTHDGTNAWTQAGGDYDPAVYADKYIDSSTNGQWVSLEIGELVDDWVSGEAENYGLMLKGDGILLQAKFDSDDASNTANTPRLSITYACECGIVCIAPQGSGNVLMTVTSTSNPAPGELLRIALLESWGYTVNTTWQKNSQSNFNSNIAANDVVFVPSTVNPSEIGTKLTNAPIGVISEVGALNDELGIATSSVPKVGDTINVSDNSHYITLPFAAGPLNIYSAAMEGLAVDGTPAPALQALADWGGTTGLAVLDEGGAMSGGGTAAGRRVLMPFGASIDLSRLNNNGRLMLQRSVVWAMKVDGTSIGNILLVVGNAGTLSSKDQGRKDLMESWGYTVTMIDDGDSQANFDTAAAANDVVYVSGTIGGGTLADKLTGSSSPIVNEFPGKIDNFGFGEAYGTISHSQLSVTDATQYISEPFSGDSVTHFTTSIDMSAPKGILAPGLERPGSIGGAGIIVTLDIGAERWDGGFAPARRVQLPFGLAETSQLTADGQTLMRRAIEWGMGAANPVFADKIILSTDSGATLGGLSFTDKDLAEYDPDADVATLYLDGAAIGNTQDIDAVHVLANDHIVLSTLGTTTIGGLTFENEDLIDYDPIADTATLFFDGSALFTAGSTDISALHIMDNGHLLLTNEYAATLGGLSFDVNDIVDYNPANDTATLFFDGDAVGFTAWINALHVLENGNLVISTNTASSLGGLNFNEGDLVEYDPVVDTATLYFDGALFSAAENVRSAHIGGGSGGGGATGPIAHWKLDETSGSTAVDSEGGHDATTSGGSWTTGTIDGGRQLNGSSDYLNAPDDDNLDLTDAFTLMGWVNNASLSGYDIMFSKGEVNNEQNFWLGTKDAEITFGFYNSGYEEFNAAAVTLQTDTWYHIAATFDNNTDAVKIYLDGDETFIDNTSLSPLANTGKLYLGRSQHGEYTDGILDDLRIYNYVLTEAEIAAIAAEGGGGGGGGGPVTYTETADLWWPGSSDTWETVSLAAYGVPANAVVEVAVMNNSGNDQKWAGVRAVGSSLERRLELHEAESGGNDVMVMHVQTNGSSEIQTYADATANIEFVLLGWWTGVSYVELFDNFSANNDGSWETYTLGDHGVLANAVAEVVMSNTRTDAERLVGLRSVGSADQRRIMLHEPESGGDEVVTMMVNTDASSDVQIYAADSSDIDFYVIGYWSTAPGTYTETGAAHGQAGSGGTWLEAGTGSFGIPANSVAQFMLSNEVDGGEYELGIRSVGSSLHRVLNLQEAESGGADLASFHVNVDTNQKMEVYSGGGTTDRYFYPIGWWVLTP